MSAFMLNTETLSKITNIIMDWFEYRFPNGFDFIPDDLAYFKDYKEGDLPKRLYKDLWEMNADAIKARYGSSSSEMFNKEDYEDGYLYDVYFNPDTEMYQAIKSIDCYLYQCSEGNLENSDFYKAIDALSRRICRQIVWDDPKWEIAKWG